MNHRKLAIMNSYYSDIKRATRLHTLMLKGMKPCPWYHDDPADKGSRYLKNITAIRDAIIDIIENSPDQKLIHASKQALADTKQRPTACCLRSAASTGNSVRNSRSTVPGLGMVVCPGADRGGSPTGGYYAPTAPNAPV
jgi:hypothetical protein